MPDPFEREVRALAYPGLERTLEDLKLIDAVTVEAEQARIVLTTQSDESYARVKALLETRFADRFTTLQIVRKVPPKKDMHYGHTASPNNRAPYAKHVIAVTSGKGGVGKSTVAVNLAIALAQKKLRVGLLDADVYGPNVARLTGTEHEKLQWNDRDKIIPSENFGLKIMSVAHTTPEMDTPLVWRSSVAVSALIQFLEDVAWGELDFLVIDMPPGTGDVQLTMAQELPLRAAVLVTTPQQISTDDVSRAVRMFEDIGVPMAGIVENMSYFIAPDTGTRYDIFGSGGGEALALRYGVPLLGQIPLDMQIREGSDLGRPPVALADESRKRLYQDIAQKLLEGIEQER